ncbi:MAG: hypothetical protein ACU84Q_20095 [Gammaproteobacteria bacterium]
MVWCVDVVGTRRNYEVPEVKVAIGVLLAVIVFVVGDWFGFFGSKPEQIPDFVHIVFMTRDVDSGKPIEGVHVVCTRPSARSVCSERLTGVPGQTEVTFGVFRNELASWLFSKDLGFSLGSSNEMSLTFVHPNYEREIIFINDDTFRFRRNQNITIKLEKSKE